MGYMLTLKRTNSLQVPFVVARACECECECVCGCCGQNLQSSNVNKIALLPVYTTKMVLVYGFFFYFFASFTLQW